MGQAPQILERELCFDAPDGASIQAFVAEPPLAGTAPRLALAPEYFGVTPWIRSVARRFARLGFRVVAPEIFARDLLPVGSPLEAYAERALRLSHPGAVADLEAALRQLGGEARAACLGFCMGGSLALELAATGVLSAAVSCYGRLRQPSLGPLRPEHPLEAAGRSRCPTLGVYGARDESIPLADVERLRAVLPPGSEVAVFEAGHAFLNADRPEKYVEAAATPAWAKIEGFLHRTLG